MKTRTKIKKSHKPFKQITQAELDSKRTEIPGYRDLNKEKQKNSGLGVELSKTGAILLLIGLMLLASISLLTVRNVDGVRAYYAPLLI